MSFMGDETVKKTESEKLSEMFEISSGSKCIRSEAGTV